MFGYLLVSVMTAAGAVGFAQHCWRTRRRSVVVMPCRSHVTKRPAYADRRPSVAIDAVTSAARAEPFDWQSVDPWLSDGPEPEQSMADGTVVEAAELILRRAASQAKHPSNGEPA